MLATFRAFAANESGATAIEYGLICALIAVFLIAALNALGISLINIFNTITAALDGALAS